MEKHFIEPVNFPFNVINRSALHTLEYYVKTLSREKFKRKLEQLKNDYPAYIEGAQTLAKIPAEILPKEGPEYSLCKRIMDYLSSEQKTLLL
ncbi:MAG: hypothetical protein QXY55_02465 [Candidatus Korarchaeota archaeon]